MADHRLNTTEECEELMLNLSERHSRGLPISSVFSEIKDKAGPGMLFSVCIFSRPRS